jgi:hypothetical protein
MSFDLVVWRDQGRPISADEASRYYAQLCDRPFDSFAPGPEMLSFVNEIAQRFHAAHSSGGLGPWAAEPDVDEAFAIMPIVSSVASEVLPLVLELAHARRLVCFDPQNSVVYQPAGPVGETRQASLELYSGQIIANPSPDKVDTEIRRLSPDNWYAILELGLNQYLQVGYGENADAPKGQYAIEHRNGSPERHLRTVTPSVEEAVVACLRYLRGETDWIKTFSWRKIEGI